MSILSYGHRCSFRRRWWYWPLRQSVLVERPPSRSIQPADQRARRFSAPTESSQRDIGVCVVYMCWHVKRWFLLCMCALQSGHIIITLLIVCVCSGSELLLCVWVSCCFHCLQSGSISVCCVVCIVKYGLFHVSWSMWL